MVGGCILCKQWFLSTTSVIKGGQQYAYTGWALQVGGRLLFHLMHDASPGADPIFPCRARVPRLTLTMHASSWDTPDCMTTGDGIEMSARHRSTLDFSARVHPAAVVASNIAAPGSRERPATMWSMRYDSAGWDSCTKNLHTHIPSLLIRQACIFCA